ncbi:uncharacterized protein (DUF1800 family) [Sphingomonas naasensis]|uniref:DUF1800 family protein n=1 Tax=Sphingomonas naasensis TaxID=1344951 RepID=A0A4S1WBF1_9SPHN|nr:DUF1800 family protein [Sphingomonas naasensis]NIJ19564.1 uncharacterized protein (DUF1800 family) [Sphingomonas naasensis]TGX39295.1 DUF1800 family protein [Sphingomonas naasensis]
MFRAGVSTALGVALLTMLSACDGGGGAGGGGSAGGGVVSVTPAPAPAPSFTEADAARFAKQASFGPTPALVARIKGLGVSAWLDEQFAATGSTYADLAVEVRRDFCTSGDTVCARQHFSRVPAASRFYADAVMAPDQLRQRVAFALGQMIVASEAEVNSAAGIAAFNQIFLDNAFGNFRDVLARVTMLGYMGDYLDMADSNKSAPSENYARELLQLFSMGPDQLNMDGTPKLDGTGVRQPNYTPEDIRGVARALTGWTYARVGGAAITDGNARDYSAPMIPVANRYDSTAKAFLGTNVAAGATQEASVAAVVDAAFNNASTAPFVSKFLIAHLVTPNPTPAYVGRVSAVFANNGSGVRGDLKAVVRAILTDAEARNAPGAAAGKVKEPVLLMTGLARVIGFTTDGYAFVNRDTSLAQPVMRAPSVFNFYPQDYPLPGSTTLRSPASKLLNTSNVLRWHNFVYDWTVGGDATRSEYTVSSGLPGSSLTQPLWSDWEALDLDAVVARIDLLMFAGTLTQPQKDALKAAGAAITNADPAVQARKRAQMMLYAAGSSPLFLVDR